MRERGEEERHDGREVGSEFFCVDSGDDGEEDVGAFLELRSVRHDGRLERGLHQRGVVRSEGLLADGFGQRSHSVLRYSTKVELVAFLDEGEEGNDSLHRRFEVRGEFRFRGVRGGSDGSNDGTLESERCGVEEREEGVNEIRDVRLDVGAENFEKTVESDAGVSLSFGVSNEIEDELWDSVRQIQSQGVEGRAVRATKLHAALRNRPPAFHTDIPKRYTPPFAPSLPDLRVLQ